MKKNRGITLVALVITIIVLLILVGVTIFFTIGENGIINLAKVAKNEYQNAENNEIDSLLNIISIDEFNINPEENANTNVKSARCVYEDCIVTDPAKYLSYTSTVEGPVLVVITGGSYNKDQTITLNCESTADVQLVNTYYKSRSNSKSTTGSTSRTSIYLIPNLSIGDTITMTRKCVCRFSSILCTGNSTRKSIG